MKEDVFRRVIVQEEKQAPRSRDQLAETEPQKRSNAKSNRCVEVEIVCHFFSEHKVSNDYYPRSESIERRDNHSLCGMLAEPVVTTAEWSVCIFRPSIAVLSKGRPAPPPLLCGFLVCIFLLLSFHSSFF